MGMACSKKKGLRFLRFAVFFFFGIILFSFVIDAAPPSSCPAIPLVVSDAREEAWALRMQEKLAERGVPVRIEPSPDYSGVPFSRRVLHPVLVQPLPIQQVPTQSMPLAPADVFDANRALLSRVMGGKAMQNPYLTQGIRDLSKKLVCVPVPK